VGAEGLPQQPASLECREVGAVLAVSIDRKIAVCIARDDHRFLYTVPCGRLMRQVGPYLAETKGNLIYISFLDESGPKMMGTLPVQEDEV